MSAPRLSSALSVAVVFAWLALAGPVAAEAPTQPAAEAPAARAALPAEPAVPPATAPAPTLTEPEIDLVTMGIGSKIWERHGHIVLCVRYHDPRRDRCYNYGIGDFRHPVEMGLGFFRGTNSFWAGADSPADMLYIYRYTDRTIWSQPLPLSPEEKQRIITKLEFDIRDENRYYAYDHFWDNCTTRVRDILDDATGGKLSAMREPTDGRTYRDLAREGFYGMTLPLLITDLAMGRVTDRVPTYYERMFLPEYMREAATKLWGVQPQVIYQRKGPPPLKDSPSGRGWLALVLLALTAPAVLAHAVGRLQRSALAFALLPQVLLGAAFWGLALISPLQYVRYNETCLVLLPLDLLLVLLPYPRARWYARARLAMLAVMAGLMAVGVLTQPLWALMFGPTVPALLVACWPRRGADS